MKREAGTVMVHKGWAKYNESHVAQLLAVVDVVVINYGHHYAGSTIEAYRADMQALFAHLSRWVAAAPPGRRGAFFRETGAQHFVGTGAFQSWEQAHPQLGSACTCAPLSGAAAKSNQILSQNAVVREAALEHPAVAVVPFYELTAPRHDMHEGPFCGFGGKDGPKPCCDCTHYCFTPQLWRSWFDTLYRETERHMARHKRASAVEKAREKAHEHVKANKHPTGMEGNGGLPIAASPADVAASPPPVAASPPPPSAPQPPAHAPPKPPKAPLPSPPAELDDSADGGFGAAVFGTNRGINDDDDVAEVSAGVNLLPAAAALYPELYGHDGQADRAAEGSREALKAAGIAGTQGRALPNNATAAVKAEAQTDEMEEEEEQAAPSSEAPPVASPPGDGSPNAIFVAAVKAAEEEAAQADAEALKKPSLAGKQASAPPATALIPPAPPPPPPASPPPPPSPPPDDDEVGREKARLHAVSALITSLSAEETPESVDSSNWVNRVRVHPPPGANAGGAALQVMAAAEAAALLLALDADVAGGLLAGMGDKAAGAVLHAMGDDGAQRALANETVVAPDRKADLLKAKAEAAGR